MKTLSTVIFLFSFPFLSLAQNRYEIFHQIEKKLHKKEYQEASQKLEQLFKKNRFPSLQAKTIYLLSWAYFLKKDYEKALLYGKILASKHKNSPYYIRGLFLSMAVSMKKGQLRTAQKILSWLSKNHSEKEEEIYTLNIFAKLMNFKKSSSLKTKLSFGLLRICLEIFDSPMQTKIIYRDRIIEKEKTNPVNKIKTPTEREKKEKKAAAVMLKKAIDSKPKSNKTTTKVHKPKFSIKKYNFLERKEKRLQQFEKRLKIQEKKLKILKILLAEKKRLLYLKEKFLEEKARNLTSDKGGVK